MNTRKCSKCGWVYPATWSGKVCRFCKEPMGEGGICPKCGQWSDKLNKTNNRCTKCSTEDHIIWRSNRRATSREWYAQWLDTIKKIPTPYSTLTEEQWMEVCRHFGGCAYCGSDDISSRSMFIPFKDGGRYCAWNIVPACERCETARKSTLNPFERMDHVLMRSPSSAAKVYDLTLENLEKITDYLGSKMNE